MIRQQALNKHHHKNLPVTKKELIERFYKNHQELIAYVNSLPQDRFNFSNDGKWTAGQQLNHVYLCLLPFPKLLASKEIILQKFGKIDRTLWDYDTVIEKYFQTTRKTLERFLPEQAITSEQKIKITESFKEILLTIQQLLSGYTEDELNSLALPHPLLGSLTIREMFYLMTFHARHHLRQVEETLANYANSSA